MVKIRYNDGLRVRAYGAPSLWTFIAGQWQQFVGENIPGAIVVVDKRHEKNGVWSNTTYTLALGGLVAEVRPARPVSEILSWEAWEGVLTVHSGDLSMEAMKCLTIAYPGLRDRIEETERLMASLAPASPPLSALVDKALAELTRTSRPDGAANPYNKEPTPEDVWEWEVAAAGIIEEEI